MKAFFVTGTDTDVGKTRVAAALLRRARERGLTTAALKPVAAGCERRDGRLVNDDALRLQAECSPPMDYQSINPVALEPPIAPHLAAAEAGVELSVASLAPHCRSVLAANADFALVEGAGGWRVPLHQGETLADLAAELGLPVILVVGVRLGCISHALLSAEAIRRDGLAIAGWVANVVDPATDRLEENLDTLAQCLPEPCLGQVAFLENPTAEALAPYLCLDSLIH